MQQDHKDYLDHIRDEGSINMYGAGILLQKEFDLTKQEARAILQEWMETFNNNNK